MFNIYSLYPCPEYNLNKDRGLGMFYVQHRYSINTYWMKNEYHYGLEISQCLCTHCIHSLDALV